jgi:hypothetical protein
LQKFLSLTIHYRQIGAISPLISTGRKEASRTSAGAPGRRAKDSEIFLQMTKFINDYTSFTRASARTAEGAGAAPGALFMLPLRENSEMIARRAAALEDELQLDMFYYFCGLCEKSF